MTVSDDPEVIALSRSVGDLLEQARALSREINNTVDVLEAFNETLPQAAPRLARGSRRIDPGLHGV